MKRSMIFLVVLSIIPLSLAFLGTSPNLQQGQRGNQVHWWGKAFVAACPNSTYADSGTPIYVYVAGSSSGPWTFQLTDHVEDNGDYDVNFYTSRAKPWVEFCTVQNDSDSLWLRNNNCAVVRFHVSLEGIKNQDICRGY